MTGSIIDAETLGDYLSGTWKRNLEWRHFGIGFDFIKMTNSIVKIEKYRASSKKKDPNSVYLTWNFGKNINEQNFGYVMKITNGNNVDQTTLNDTDPLNTNKTLGSSVLLLQWQCSGESCSGYYHIKTNTLNLNFILKKHTITVLYRIIDENTMTLSCIEIDDDHTPVLQIGQMCRLNLKKYQNILKQNKR
mmetsp:Transcript_53191/g.65203  ORF Transcript_53191/g.65203 Transcript_53191/m.65203 type:complete len:191 (+) Transcript_53191:37-609(+)